MNDIAAYYVERVGPDMWAVNLVDGDGTRTLMLTMDRIAALTVRTLLEETYKTAFGAGLVAQKYFPAEIQAFGYLPASRPA